MMRASAVVLSAAVLFLGGAVAAPTAAAAPPDLPPDHGGCDYFHWHDGDLQEGRLPRYHYHLCTPPPP